MADETKAMQKTEENVTAAPTAVKEPEMSELDRIFMEAGQNLPAAKAAETPLPAETQLSEEEKKKVDEIAASIDLSDSSAVMAYGASTQKQMADFSERTLDSVRTKDMGEVGDMITGLVGELKNFQIDENEHGIMKLFKKSANNINTLKAKYNKVEGNVKVISDELQKRQVVLMKDIDILDKLYALNLKYFKELSVYIIAGKKKLEEVRTGELAEAQKKAEATGAQEDVQYAKDLAAQCDRFEKKLYDLELTKTIALQTGPQIRMVQSSDTAMAEKIQSTILNTIPLWKNQMVIAIGIEHAGQAAKAERQVNDMTNELLKKNAANLKTATIETAKESERGIVDIETLKNTNEQLISTMDEILRIQTEGKEKRKAAEAELVQIEGELKSKMLEAAKM